MDQQTSERINRVQQAISRLPENPAKHIYWIVYNNDMITYTENLISSIKGLEYLEKFVTVVSRTDPSNQRAKGTVWFDPGLLDLIGNGNG